MASSNVTSRRPPVHNHEGVRAVRNPTALSELRRSILCSMLFEDQYYESGKDQAKRVAELITQCDPFEVSKLAIEARTQMYLRHMPLFLTRELARVKGNGQIVATTLRQIIERPDELTEYCALYWAGREKGSRKREPLSAGSKNGLRAAFLKFNAYSLAKYRDEDKAVKLRDVLRLVRPKPTTAEQSETFKALRQGTLKSADTWESELSLGKDKKTTFERLLSEHKLGGLATLRNLRGMEKAGVDPKLIRERLAGDFKYVLPFRFLAAARYAPAWVSELSDAMLKVCTAQTRLPGRTLVLVDTSPSMEATISAKSEMTRTDAGAGLAVLLREIGEYTRVFAFSSHLAEVPAHRGLPLADAIKRAVPSNGTLLGAAIAEMNKLPHDRLIVVTDEESQDPVGAPVAKNAYMVNLAGYQYGVGFGQWTRVTGWSDRIVDFIRAVEAEKLKESETEFTGVKG